MQESGLVSSKPLMEERLLLESMQLEGDLHTLLDHSLRNEYLDYYCQLTYLTPIMLRSTPSQNWNSSQQKKVA